MTTRYREFDQGVRLATRPDTRGYYRVRWTDPRTGKPRDARRTNAADAEDLARQLSAGLADPTLHDAPDATPLGDEPLIALIDSWLNPNEHTDVSLAYLRGSEGALRRYTSEHTDLPCRQWAPQHTRAMIDLGRERGLKNSSLATLLRLLRSVSAYGRERGWLQPNQDPIAGIKVRDRKQSLDVADLPTADQIERLADELQAVGTRDWGRTFILLLAYTGLRCGEALGLEARHIDLDQGTIRVEQQFSTWGVIAPPKHESIRTTIFPSWLDGALAEQVDRAGDGPLFPNQSGGHERYQTLQDRFQIARERAGWPKDRDGKHRWSLHDLRHYFCTWALSKDGLNLDVAEVAKAAGHASPATTYGIYVQSRSDWTLRAREASREASR